MDPNLYAAFVVATTIMILLPGPSVMLTVGHSLAHGWRKAMITVAGATCGIGIQLGITLAGMASMLALMADWFEAVRWAGVAYLLWLGFRQWRTPVEPNAKAGSPSSAVAGRALFAQGLVVTMANPKSLVFLAAFFPQFVDPNAPWGPQIILMGMSFLAITYLFTGLWALAAGRARELLATRRALLLRNRVAGSLMIGAGLGLAVARR